MVLLPWKVYQPIVSYQLLVAVSKQDVNKTNLPRGPLNGKEDAWKPYKTVQVVQVLYYF